MSKSIMTRGKGIAIWGLWFGLVGWGNGLSGPAPLALLPENPHYFKFRGNPTVIITSGEHYGAVLNRDFNFVTYLDTLAADGLNGTRTWAGVYCEPPGAFNITSNTLAPLPGRFLCPWARSPSPGYANGGNKFDLTQWDKDYFRRLEAFLAHASRRGIIVELNLFCPFYEEGMWRLSPMNAANNVNGLGGVSRTNVYTLDRHGGLLAVQEALVRRLVTALKDFDNLYYEICNEPYFGGVTLDWQHHIAEVIRQTEQSLGVRHLISQNVANGRATLSHPHPAIDLFNFHYASPPDTVAANYHWNKPIGDNETGFQGTGNRVYRHEAWEFLMAGGALFNHLDYSFAVGREDGTFAYPTNTPGGGNAELRRQLKLLAQFLRHFDLRKTQPDRSVVKTVQPAQVRVQVLSESNRQYGLFLSGSTQAVLRLDLPAGRYRLEWLDPVSGVIQDRQHLKHIGGETSLTSPVYREDIALRLWR